MGGAMIQYYKDLVTIDELRENPDRFNHDIYSNRQKISDFINQVDNELLINLLIGYCIVSERKRLGLLASADVINNLSLIAKQINKKEMFTREVKKVQQPDSIDRLKAITNEQWRKFAEKYNLEFGIDCNDRFNICKNGKNRLCQQYFYIRDNNLEQRRRVMDTLLFFKNILAESVSEFEYAQNIHDLITELEGM